VSRVYRHPCGCKTTEERWIELCPACKAEHDERHQRAHAEHIERQASREAQLAQGVA
jgi:hypothetical protein